MTGALRVAVVVAALGACGTAWAASGLGFLRNSPMSRFDERDFELLRAAAVEVLESRERGASRAWENPATGHSGTVTVIGRFTHEQRPCRRLRVQNRAGTLDGEVRYTVCRTAEEGWRLEPDVPAPRR